MEQGSDAAYISISIYQILRLLLRNFKWTAQANIGFWLGLLGHDGGMYLCQKEEVHIKRQGALL